MNNGLQSMEQAAVEVLAGILIPLASRSLLVPTVAVAEIVPYQKARHLENAPDWLLGEFLWRNQSVPLLSLELLCGEQMPAPTSANRVVVFNNTGISDELPFLAIRSAGIPKLIQVSAEDMRVSETAPRPFENLRVMLQGEETVIPDITSLEQVWLEWLARQ